MRECREAGIRVVLITGDHPVTAHAVAEELGIEHSDERPVVTGAELAAAPPDEQARLADDATLFARVTPDQKLGIVEALRLLQQQGLVPVRQDDAAATYAAKILKSEGQIDWRIDAQQIERALLDAGTLAVLPNAAVSIDGGEGFNRTAVLGTEASDAFVHTGATLTGANRTGDNETGVIW